jgi:acyl-CoA synthetase (AMP-forming)/AMP-acid ligase II
MTFASDHTFNFMELTRQRAADDGGQTAYTFLEFHPEETIQSSVTYEQLDIRARVLAAQLQEVASRGSRVLLLYRPGLEFICGFLGCFYSGMIAVPVGAPKLGHRSDRLLGIIADSKPAVILATASVRRGMQRLVDAAHAMNWMCSDEIDDSQAHRWVQPRVVPEDLAFLQYSSGSTGHPKGIKVTHGNLAHQSAVFHRQTGATHESCFVSWLPTFHDLGLIAGVLQPLYGGYLGVQMAPESFVEAPYRWLKAISDCRADISAAPNFAYELCIAKVTPEFRAGLDLSTWRFALNGAEPVRAKTIDDFAEAFASSGFRRSAFYPAYGLAEATLLVSGGNTEDELRARRFKADALEQDRVLAADDEDTAARALVGYALPVSDQELVIVNPTTQRRADADEVGEIWLSSPSVSAGYWNRRAETEEIFTARIADSTGGPYLRTGDLGFIHNQEMFICGRLKDLILIRGRNYHAPDIELTVENSHQALRTGCGAAFSVEIDEEERLVVAHEVDRQFKVPDGTTFDQIILGIRQAIAAQHQLQVHAVVLLRHGTIPKTSSGKIQRRECRARHLAGRLIIRASWAATETATEGHALTKSAGTEQAHTHLPSEAHATR